jgi:hypothetical protein
MVPVHGPESHYRSAMEYFAVNQQHGTDGALVTKEGLPFGGSQTSEAVYIPYQGKIVEVKPGRGGMMEAREQLRRIEEEEEDRYLMQVDTGRRRMRGGY